MIINSIQMFPVDNSIIDINEVRDYYTKTKKQGEISTLTNIYKIVNSNKIFSGTSGKKEVSFFKFRNNFYYVENEYGPYVIGYSASLNTNLCFSYNIHKTSYYFFNIDILNGFNIVKYIYNISNAILVNSDFQGNFLFKDTIFEKKEEEMLFKKIIEINNITSAKFVDGEWIFEKPPIKDEDGFPLLDLAINTVVNNPISLFDELLDDPISPNLVDPVGQLTAGDFGF